MEQSSDGFLLLKIHLPLTACWVQGPPAAGGGQDGSCGSHPTMQSSAADMEAEVRHLPSCPSCYEWGSHQLSLLFQLQRHGPRVALPDWLVGKQGLGKVPPGSVIPWWLGLADFAIAYFPTPHLS